MSSLVVLLYRAALCLLPPAFRRQYGTAMVEDARLVLEDAVRAGALSHVLAVGRLTADLIRTWLREWGAVAAEWLGGRRVSYTWKHEMDALIQDLRHGVRTLLRHPAYAAVAVLTLALGIGGTTAIYTVLEKVVLDPLPYPEAERLVRIKNPVPSVGAGTEWQVSPAQYLHYREHANSFEAIGLYNVGGANLAGPGGPVRGRVASVTASVFRMLGARAVLGRVPGEADDRPDAAPVAVLSNGFWQRRYGGDPGVLGRTVRLNDSPYEIIGVLAPGLSLPEVDGRPDVWITYRLDPTRRSGFRSHVNPGIAKLAPGATLESAQAELERMLGGMAEQGVYTQGFLDRYGFQPRLYSLKAYVVGDAARNLWILLGAVGLVLLIAAANVANLFLVRIEGRRRELAVRTALGASRGAVARHFLAESLVLSLAGGLLALLLGSLGVQWLVSLAPASVPRLDEVRLDASVLAFSGTVALAVAVALTAVAALRRRDLAGIGTLGDGGRAATAGRERQRVRSTLVITQVALALVLIVGAGLLFESFRRLRAVDPGIDPEGVIAMELYLPSGRYGSQQERWQFYRAALERIGAIPGVEAAGFSTALPFTDGYGCTSQGFEDRDVYDRIEAIGQTMCAGQEPTSPGYFEALGIPLLRGRLFTDADNDDPSSAAVIVSEAFAERFWPGEDPIGKGVAPNGWNDRGFYRVVGMVGDVYPASVQDEPAIAVYYPIVPDSGGFSSAAARLAVRTSLANPVSVSPRVQQVIEELDPLIPVANIEEMRAIVDRSMSRLSFTLVLLGVAASVALGLAAIGLYGVISYVVARRTNEIGVRIALGARPWRVEGLVVMGSLRLVLLGMVAGVAGALGVTRVLQGLLYGVEPTHPAAYAGAAAVLAGVAALASWLPARRAAGVDPSEALRVE